MGLSIADRTGQVFDKFSSFRPLSGKWGYRFDEEGNVELVARVSVPSRGNGVIDLIDINRKLKALASQVSVPSRGNGVIDTRL